MPERVVCSPETNRLFVGSDEGKLYLYDGTSHDPIAALEFGDDVENPRYDAADRRVYVGYGDEGVGAIAIGDVNTPQRLTQEFKLGAHPESFQLEKSGPHNYVNVADLKEIAVIDRNTGKIARWPLTADGNFPMALDEAEYRRGESCPGKTCSGRYELGLRDRRVALRAELPRCVPRRRA